jgi:beta-mannosidase
VALSNWTYTRTFQVTPAQARARSIHLVADGLDTVAVVRVNGRVVGTAQSQFIQHSFAVPASLIDGKAGAVTTVSVAFTSAVTYAAAESARLEAQTGRSFTPECPNAIQHGCR